MFVRRWEVGGGMSFSRMVRLFWELFCEIAFVAPAQGTRMPRLEN